MIKLLLYSILFVSISYSKITTASEQPNRYMPLLKGRRVALVVNHSSIVGDIHIVDFLLKNHIKVTKIFAPEHGFRGRSDAGSHIKNSRDTKTNLPIISLYGKHKKPSKDDLKNIDIILFDIQDVGVRFYTYLSTLHYVMESAGEYHTPLVVLDRPNPNGHYVDGPILKSRYRSFVGLDPIPIVYGMTIGEYAMMLKGERWVKYADRLKLKVIPLQGYQHNMPYHLPIKPSPNLPTDNSIALYPSLALFEGTTFSAGRGTAKPFELYGDPNYQDRSFSFVPRSRAGAKYPKHRGRRCYGVDLSRVALSTIRREKRINLSYLMDAYRRYPQKDRFFLKNRFFDKLSGSNRLREQIISGSSEATIRKSWQRDLDRFHKIRQKYLIYP